MRRIADGEVYAVPATIDDPAILDALADRLFGDGAALPSVNGPVDAARAFAARWSRLAGVAASVQMEERIYEAATVSPPRDVPGAMRPYRATDRPLAIEWIDAFFAEAMPDSPEADAERFVDARALFIDTVHFLVTSSYVSQ